MALLLQRFLHILGQVLGLRLRENEDEDLVVGLRVDVGGVVDAGVELILRPHRLLLQVLNLLLQNLLSILQGLPRQIQHDIGVVAPVNFLQNLFAGCKCVLLCAEFFLVFGDDAVHEGLIGFA